MAVNTHPSRHDNHLILSVATSLMLMTSDSDFSDMVLANSSVSLRTMLEDLVARWAPLGSELKDSLCGLRSVLSASSYRDKYLITPTEINYLICYYTVGN